MSDQNEQPNLSHAQTEAEQLREEFRLLKLEVDALQVHLLAAKAPWYRQVSSVISILALLFSFGTTIVSYHRTQRQDEQTTREALRSLLQRAIALPKEEIEMIQKYENEPATVEQLAGLVRHENQMLASQAVSLAKEISHVLSSSELLMTADVAHLAEMDTEASALADLALEHASTTIDLLAVLRTKARYSYASGDIAGGEKWYTKALETSGKFNSSDPIRAMASRIDTEDSWARDELSIGRCAEAATHVSNALSFEPKFRPSDWDQVVAPVKSTQKALGERCGIK